MPVDCDGDIGTFDVKENVLVCINIEERIMVVVWEDAVFNEDLTTDLASMLLYI